MHINGGKYEGYVFGLVKGVYTLDEFVKRLDMFECVTPDSVMLFINILGFKAFNENYGFEEGNKFLKKLTSSIAHYFNIKEDDLVCNVSGDRFFVLFHTVSKDDIISRIFQVEAEVNNVGRAIHLELEVGIYGIPFDDESEKGSLLKSGMTYVRMMDKAKQACDFIEKVFGQNYCFYNSEIDEKINLQHYIITDFDIAIRNGYIRPYYQRQVRTLTRQVCGYEALARWIDPKYGMISPVVFVPVLENAHLIHRLDSHMVRMVCRDIRECREKGLPIQAVSVNLSRMDFQMCDIFQVVDDCRQEFGLSPDLINIEITESAMADKEDSVVVGISRFLSGGYQIWMDDFGSGYSTLNVLRNFDMNVVKLDMEFIRGLNKDPKAEVILSSMVSLIKELGSRTVAEGIETREQFEFLRSIGCEIIQGFYFGRPDTKENTIALMSSGSGYESPARKNYQEKIGQVNFVGVRPLQYKSMQVHSDLPITVMEIEGKKIRHIYSNEAYMELMREIGINSLEEMNERNNIEDLEENKLFLATARQCEKTGKIEKCDFVINGSIITVRMRFLARDEDLSAYIVISRNLELGETYKQVEGLQAGLSHLLSLYFRVDLYDEDGTVYNIYLNSSQGRITDETTDQRDAVRMYARRYLFDSEMERFCRYYDMSDIHERVKASGGRYVVDYFHSKIPGEEGRVQKYLILPFYFREHWKYLSICRYADEVPAQFAK